MYMLNTLGKYICIIYIHTVSVEGTSILKYINPQVTCEYSHMPMII